MVGAHGKDEEAELENFCGESAPPSSPSAENPDEDEPADKEHVTKRGLLKVISENRDILNFTFYPNIPYLLSAHLL